MAVTVAFRCSRARLSTASFALKKKKTLPVHSALAWTPYREHSIRAPAAIRWPEQLSLGRLVHHAIDGVLFQATVLLRWIVGLGFLFAATGVVVGSRMAQDVSECAPRLDESRGPVAGLHRDNPRESRGSLACTSVRFLIKASSVLCTSWTWYRKGSGFGSASARNAFATPVFGERVKGMPPGRFIEIGPGGGKMTDRLLKRGGRARSTIYRRRR